MNAIKIQRIPWASRALWSTPATFTKVAKIWEQTPKALKLPIAAAWIDVPHWRSWKAAAAGLFLLQEVPGVSTALLQSPPVPPVAAQPPTPPIPLPLWEQITNKNLAFCIQKISYLSVLQTLYACSGVQDSSALFQLLDEAAQSPEPSLWKIFLSNHGNTMSFWGKIKSAVVYALTWSWIPIIPKTVDAYMKGILEELRISLTKNGEKRNRFLHGLIADLDSFFDIYNGAIESYAKDANRKGTLSHYQKIAVERIPLKRFSQIRLDRFAPRIRFGFGILDRFFSSCIHKVVNQNILPIVLSNMASIGQETIQKRNIPFYIAFAKTLTSQITNLRDALSQPPSSAPGIETGMETGMEIGAFASIVKKFLWSLHMAECGSVEEVREKIEELKQPKALVDAGFQQGIQLGIQTGLALGFDYLSKPENLEGLLATLFDNITHSLTDHPPITNEEWSNMPATYTREKTLLTQAAFSFFKQLIQKVLDDTVHGQVHPKFSDAQFGQIAGMAAFLAGFAVENAPEQYSALKAPLKISLATAGALFAATVSNLENLAKKKWLKASTHILTMGALAGTLSHFSQTVAFAKNYFATTLATATFEYSGAKTLQNTIRAGTAFATPKVNGVFVQSYEHFFTNEIVLKSVAKILINQFTTIFNE